MAYQNTGDVVDARDVVDEFPVKNTPSCITWYGGRLWIATHTLLVNSRMVAYYLDKKTDKLIASVIIKFRKRCRELRSMIPETYI